MPFQDFKKLTFTTGDLEQTYSVPGNARSIAVQAIGGPIDMRLATGTTTDEWTFSDGDKELFKGRDLAGQMLYFTGVNGAVLQIRPLIGFDG